MVGTVSQRAQELNWYHTLDLGDGVVTKGYVDTRSCADSVLLPASLAGKRCLDVGTQNGFWAFELERRGAASVTAIDLAKAIDADWPPRTLLDPDSDELRDDRQPSRMAFELAKEALGSNVEWKGINVYDLDPDTMGTFDFVFMGSLLLHLRDPVRALDRIRRVCTGEAVFFDTITFLESVTFRKTPRARLHGNRVWWWTPNKSGLHQMITSAGWDVTDVSPILFVKRGELFRKVTARHVLQGGVDTLMIRLKGAPHAAFRARPAG